MPLALLTLLAAIVAATAYFFSKTWLPILSTDDAGVDHQLILNFILLGIVFCATQLALGLFLWKYRERQAPSKVGVVAQPDIRVELTWLTLAAMLFLGLNIAGAFFSPARTAMVSDMAKPAIPVEVTGVQFRWYFRSPGRDGKFGRTEAKLVDAAEGNPLGIDRSDPAAADDVVGAELVIPANRDVALTLRAQDVIHSLFVPALRLKQDAVPGQAIIIHIRATKTGVYEIACAQLCGMGHYQMNAKLKVVPEAEYVAELKQR
jgi:cytochrome c oxidase subunit 2